MPQIDIHADDYALTINTSKEMLECIKAGKLNSISIVPNMSCFEECMELFYEVIPTLSFLPLITVHLDFVEGKCLAGAKQTPLLTGENGLIRLSWGGLFQLSYLPWKKEAAKEQLKLEIKAQTERILRVLARCRTIARENAVPWAQKGLRIDSHQHAHMIPVVWEALMEAIVEENYQVEYIRNSKEVLGVFLTETALWKTYRPVNFVKNRLLSLYSHKVDDYYRRCRMKPMYMWGLVMSGHMDYDRIVTLYPKMAAKAEKSGRTLEILFHPGRMLPEEETEEIGGKAAEDFYMSEDRNVEREAVMEVHHAEAFEKSREEKCSG